jgi:CRP/FNR family transcriptional regulator
MKKLEAVNTCSFFGTLNTKEKDKLVSVSIEKEFNRGDTILQEGEKSSFVYIIVSGQVKATRFTPEGMELILEIFGQCDIIGQVSVILGEPYYFTAAALTPVKINVIKKEEFVHLVRTNPEISGKAINNLCLRLRESQKKLEEFISDKVEQRVAKLLFALAEKMGTEIPFTRQEIASMVGTTIETAIRVTSRFKEAKIIKTSRGKINIIDKQKLSLIANGPPINLI